MAGSEWEHASDRLKSDKEVVISAVLSSPASIKYADHKLQSDPDVILEALKKGYYELDGERFSEIDEVMVYASYRLVSDKEFMLKAIKIYPDSYRYASTNLINDKDFILDAVRSNSGVLEFLDSDLRSDKEIIMTAVQGVDTDSKVDFENNEAEDGTLRMPDATCRHKDGVDFNKLELLRKRMLLSVTDLASILGTSRMSYYTWLEGGEIRKSNIKKINLKIDKLKNIISKYNWPNNVLELEQKDRKAKLIKLLEQC